MKLEEITGSKEQPFEFLPNDWVTLCCNYGIYRLNSLYKFFCFFDKVELNKDKEGKRPDMYLVAMGFPSYFN